MVDQSFKRLSPVPRIILHTNEKWMVSAEMSRRVPYVTKEHNLNDYIFIQPSKSVDFRAIKQSLNTEGILQHGKDQDQETVCDSGSSWINSQRRRQESCFSESVSL